MGYTSYVEPPDIEDHPLIGPALYLLHGMFPGGKIRDGEWDRILYKHDGNRNPHMDLHRAHQECLAKQAEWQADLRAKQAAHDNLNERSTA